MRITVKTNRRAASVFRLLEELETRTLMTTYTSVLTPMTGGIKDGSGAGPQGLFVDTGSGFIYGTTAFGGPKKYGTVFVIAPGEHTARTVAWFNGKNGLSPTGPLVLDSAGNLFGIATGGGDNNRGTVWGILAADLAATHSSNDTTSIIQTLHSFDGAGGSYPISGLTVDNAGNLWGTTVGVKVTYAKDKAVVFEVMPNLANLTSSHFDAVATFGKGVLPGSLTIDLSDNTVYGVTRNSGTKGNGSIFKLASDNTFQTLFSFTKSTGTTPNCQLNFHNGLLYGTTLKDGPNGGGTLFSLDPNADPNDTTQGFITLVSFNGSNGSRPLGNLIIDSNENIFGVTALGGKNGVGTVFEAVHGTGSTYTLSKPPLFSFKGKNTGTNPTGSLFMNSSGQFFGATFSGGSKEKGAVFELDPG